MRWQPRAAPGYRQWRLVSLDGSTLDVADAPGNAAAFRRPGSSRGDSAYPQIRFVSLVESGTHVLFASKMAAYSTSEIVLARAVLHSLKPGMLCLADRNFFSYALWDQARATAGRPAVAHQEEHAATLRTAPA